MQYLLEQSSRNFAAYVNFSVQDRTNAVEQFDGGIQLGNVTIRAGPQCACGISRFIPLRQNENGDLGMPALQNANQVKGFAIFKLQIH